MKKQINTQVKLHFEKTTYKNKMFYQKSLSIALRCLSRQFRIYFQISCYFMCIEIQELKCNHKDIYTCMECKQVFNFRTLYA